MEAKNDSQEQSNGTPGKIVSAGVPEKVIVPISQTGTTEEDQQEQSNDDEQSQNLGDTTGDKPVEKTAEQIKDENDQLIKLMAERGIVFDGNFDALKEKLQPTKPAPALEEQTEEQKKMAEAAVEKRILDLYIDNGGKVEDIVALKNIANSDLRELSIATIKKEMKEEGFSEDAIQHIIQERYYQLNPDEAEQFIDESDEDFAARKELLKQKVALGTKKLESKGAHIKSQAAQVIEGLRNAIKEQDLQKQEEEKTLSMVDSHFKSLSREMTFELGEANGQKTLPIQYKVSDSEIAEALVETKEFAVKNSISFNEDGGESLAKIAGIILRNKVLETAVKVAVSEGGDRQVALFQKTFPGILPSDIGVGGNRTNSGRKGVFVSAGKAEPMSVKHN